MPLIQNFDPEQLATPLRSLLKQFAGAAYSVAPERESELVSLADDLKIRIWLNTTVDLFEVSVSRLLRKIDFPLAALERLWAYAYCYSLLFDLLQTAPAGTHIDLRIDGEAASARRLLLWANEAEITSKHSSWPENTPRPDSVVEDPRIAPANAIFLTMSGFILLHGIGHLALEHSTEMGLSPEDSVKQEFEAHEWAAAWMLSKWSEYRNDELEFLRRSVGIAFALSMIGGLEIYSEAPERLTHPTAPDRLLAFLDHFVAQSEGPVLPRAEQAWIVPAAVFQVHLLKAGKAFDFDQTFSTFRDYLLAVREVF